MIWTCEEQILRLFVVCALILWIPRNHLNSNASEIKGTCKSILGKPGTCISLLKCPTLLQPLLLNFQARRETIRRLTCGTDGDDPKVCCPLSENAEAEADTTSWRLAQVNQDNCGLVPSLGFRIVGGIEPPPNSFPWLVRLGYRSEGGSRESIDFKCGGSILNERYIVTAAHCVLDSKPVEIIVGESSGSSSCKSELRPKLRNRYLVESITLHEKYSKETRQNDIAVVRVARNISFRDDAARPICLDSTEAGTDEDDVKFANVVGWFGNGYEVPHCANLIQLLKLPIIPLTQCQRTYDKLATLNETQICAGGEKDYDTCPGDSGNPLMVERGRKYYMIGLVSYGPTNCGTEGYPGIYTKVKDFLPWILEQIKLE